MRHKFLVLALILASCTTATLNDGKNTVSFRGVKVFSPTVLALRSGNCSVPSVDASGVIAPESPPPAPAAGAGGDPCRTEEVTINGVDVKGLASIIMTSIISSMAAIATGA